MKLIMEDGLLAKLSNIIQKKRDKIHQGWADYEENRKDYDRLDQMVLMLKDLGYSNSELNALQGYLQLSKNADGSRGIDYDENLLFQAALNNKLDFEKIQFLGKVAASNSKFNLDDFIFMSSAKSVDQMKMLYYANEKGIPFDDIGSFNGKPPNANQIMSVITNYDEADKADKITPQQERLKFLKAKGYYDIANFLTSDEYEDVPDQLIADAIVALTNGASKSSVRAAIDTLENGGNRINADSYSVFGIPETTPRFSLADIRNKDRKTLARQTVPKKTISSNSEQETPAERINSDEADDNQ